MQTPPEQSNASEDFGEDFGKDLGKSKDPTESENPVEPKPKKAYKPQKRMASLNLTPEGFKAMDKLQKLSGHSRKDVVSKALVESITKALNVPPVRFKMLDSEFLLMLQQEVVGLEALGKNLRFRINKERHKDPEQVPVLVIELDKLKKVIEGLEVLEEVIRRKRVLIDGLTSADYEGLKGIPEWLVSFRKTAENQNEKEKKKRLERYDLIERIVKILL